MKSLSYFALIAFFVALSATRSLAHYDHDDKGYFDAHHHHHPFIHYHGHRGYWDHDDSGARIFINI